LNKSILLHVCCVHCAAYTIEYWQERGYGVTAYWFNPNIHPHDEHQQRMEAMIEYASSKNIPLIFGGYDPMVYFLSVVKNQNTRCRSCFDIRLSSTASIAREGGYTGFSSTLLISPHQEHELIKETGTRVAAQTGVEFFYSDLRKRYSDSRHITKPLELYRQRYCGCIYSRLERENILGKN
jgi:predicted adenine nucleotide alpha hydrolase (AANH) superfamily ATPase